MRSDIVRPRDREKHEHQSTDDDRAREELDEEQVCCTVKRAMKTWMMDKLVLMLGVLT